MRPSACAVLIAISGLFISANPNLYPEKSSPDLRPIAMCGGGLDWELVIGDSAKTPVLFDNLGSFTFPIDTKNNEAQS